MNKLIEIQNGTLGYEKTPILEALNLTIFENEFIAIIGPNGSGKTTLVRSLLGLQPLYNGKIERSKNLGKVGYVPQHARLNLNVPVTVDEFIKLKKNQDPNEQDKLMKALGLPEELLVKPLKNLSTGQRQRILVLFALLGKPKLICLDEATDGLDFKAQKEFFELIAQIRAESNTTVILISHDITAVGSYATRAVCLNRSLLYDGPSNSPEFHSCLHNIYGKDSVIHHHEHGHKH